ncbi:MAG: site-2 protease family protein [Limnochordia bacterium]|jgi:stage IV sporulation protein FB
MNIAVIGGIRLLVHPAFLIIVLAMAFLGYFFHLALIFALVLLHELGHILAARSFGLQVREVELLPFGGVARIDGLLEADPLIEGAIALAGPLTSFFLAGLTYYLLQVEAFPIPWLHIALRTNLAVGTLNLLPAMPLDGGRLYRAWLVKHIGYRQAAAQGARLGRFLALILACLGLVDFWYRGRYPGLLIIAFFLYINAGREQGMAIYVLLTSLARKQGELRAKGVLPAQQLIVGAHTPLKDVVKYFTPPRYSLLTVVDEEGKVMGLVSEGEVLEGLLEGGGGTPIGQILRSRF